MEIQSEVIPERAPSDTRDPSVGHGAESLAPTMGPRNESSFIKLDGESSVGYHRMMEVMERAYSSVDDGVPTDEEIIRSSGWWFRIVLKLHLEGVVLRIWDFILDHR